MNSRLFFCLLFAQIFLLAAVASALTPESKEVKALTKKGLDVLERLPPSSQPGGRVLTALAFIKSNKADHAIVKNTIRDVRAMTDAAWTGSDTVYSLGLGIIFLSEIYEQQDAAQLQRLVDALLKKQKPHGGWGYDTDPQGDISQTQYAVLAMWGAKQVGANVPQERIEKVTEYLIRVQDPNGAWGYKGIDPGNYNRVAQQTTRHSLAAAGLGSLCVCADLLGIHRKGGQGNETGMPDALKVIAKPKAEEAGSVQTTVDRDRLDRAIEDGTRWFASNYAVQVQSWNLYYLYGLERCEAFRELYTRKIVKEPQWYNDGYALLNQKFAAEGWAGDDSNTVSTAFALLFLQRSSKKAIAKVHKDLGEGVLTSGKGLPTDLANATVKRGKIVDSPLAGEVDDILAMLDDPENPELSRILESNEDLKLDGNLTKRTGQIAKLRALVSSGTWESRMVAVRALGKSRELDNVPSLLYALTDPDVRVVREADAGLRFISRKFQGVGLPDAPDRPAIQQARKAWRDWYPAIRPDAQLID